MVKIVCFSCQKEIHFSQAKIGLREECQHCGSDVHVCRNCVFYDVGSYNECKETSADRVKEKDRANFCDYFQLNTSSQAQVDKAAALRAAAEALFKKS